MERILDGWSRFSLLEKEGDWVRLNKKQQLAGSNEKVLAVKFLNRRVLNVDAIGRNFRAAWKTRKGFVIQQVGDHLCFSFLNWRMMQRGCSPMNRGALTNTWCYFIIWKGHALCEA